jgi:hypothetical protein
VLAADKIAVVLQCAFVEFVSTIVELYAVVAERPTNGRFGRWPEWRCRSAGRASDDVDLQDETPGYSQYRRSQSQKIQFFGISPLSGISHEAVKVTTQ